MRNQAVVQNSLLNKSKSWDKEGKTGSRAGGRSGESVEVDGQNQEGAHQRCSGSEYVSTRTVRLEQTVQEAQRKTRFMAAVREDMRMQRTGTRTL